MSEPRDYENLDPETSGRWGNIGVGEMLLLRALYEPDELRNLHQEELASRGWISLKTDLKDWSDKEARWNVMNHLGGLVYDARQRRAQENRNQEPEEGNHVEGANE